MKLHETRRRFKKYLTAENAENRREKPETDFLSLWFLRILCGEDLKTLTTTVFVLKTKAPRMGVNIIPAFFQKTDVRALQAIGNLQG